ncbi:exosome complex exonuclease Rrp41 [Candidatus Woesearchaeota archaeon]|nr:exosome complex exonuclease Rrp41 [Candidatus Woesearchaeota archaeon]
MGKYTKRFDGRKMNETRPIIAKAGVIKNADGSAYFKIGDTIAYAAVYGPREVYPKFMQNPKKGILRVNYNMMAFSGPGERNRPGPNRRAKEISMVSEKALLPVVDLDKYPNTVIDIYIELPQTDAGSRCAGISAASIALADAGITMKDMVPAVAVGMVGDTPVVDLSYHEEQPGDGMEAVDIPIAMIPSTGEVTLLQMDGIAKPEEILKVIELAKEACVVIAEQQRVALRNKYQADSKEGDAQ